MADPSNSAEPRGRSARKRQAILDAATELFLGEGYQGTSMDQVAALASVSKQTIYKKFASKELLIAAILHGITERVGEFIEDRVFTLRTTNDLARDLQSLARHYVATVMKSQVLQLRRLVIEEAGRLPDLARSYYEGVPERTLAALSTSFRELAEQGLLKVEDPNLAAHHFAFLVIGSPLDKAMFYAHDLSISASELNRIADAGVRVFLAAYQPR